MAFTPVLICGFSNWSNDCCRMVPFSYAIANWMFSATVDFGSVHNFCWTSLFAMFTMKTSFTRLLHFAANPFNSFQNCTRVSPSFYFLLRNLNLSKFSCSGFLKQSLQFLSRSVRLTLAIMLFGNLSAIVLRAAAPNARYKTLRAFFAAGISSRSPIRFLSFVPVIFVSSVIEMLFFAMRATSNRSSHFSSSN